MKLLNDITTNIKSFEVDNSFIKKYRNILGDRIHDSYEIEKLYFYKTTIIKNGIVEISWTFKYNKSHSFNKPLNNETIILLEKLYNNHQRNIKLKNILHED